MFVAATKYLTIVGKLISGFGWLAQQSSLPTLLLFLHFFFGNTAKVLLLGSYARVFPCGDDMQQSTIDKEYLIKQKTWKLWCNICKVSKDALRKKVELFNNKLYSVTMNINMCRYYLPAWLNCQKSKGVKPHKYLNQNKSMSNVC